MSAFVHYSSSLLSICNTLSFISCVRPLFQKLLPMYPHVLLATFNVSWSLFPQFGHFLWIVLLLLHNFRFLFLFYCMSHRCKSRITIILLLLWLLLLFSFWHFFFLFFSWKTLPFLFRLFSSLCSCC